MNTRVDRRLRLLAIFIISFVALFAMSQSALADNAVLQGDQIANGATVENDVLLNGTDVSLNGTVDGDAFAVGRNVVINGDVKGSMFVLAENIVINGNIDGSVYGLAVSLNALSNSSIGRSLYFLGVSLVTESDAQIGRDLTAVTLGARLAGNNAARDTKAIIGIIEIGKLILDRINNVTTGKPVAALQPATFVTAANNHSSGARLFAAAVGPVGSSAARSFQAQDEGETEDEAAPSAAETWIVERLRDLITLLIIGGLALWLIPTKVDQWSNQVRQRPLAAGGWGLVAYIIGFVGAVILFMLILIIGISFAVVTLWGLAWTWWAIAFAALALAFALFILAVAYGSKIIVAYLVGRLILERFGAQPDMRKPWPLLLGLTLYVLVCGIPYLGWAISLIVTFLGLGGIWLAYMAGKGQSSASVEAAKTDE
ncbi:MAG: hypothetical protein R3293_20180 [Candidatus Promineifilaceae bacterium]|nr:hypothetical protein [Candidatus Promineifilaceae bacterium]